MNKGKGMTVPFVVMIVSVIIAVVSISIGLTAAYLTDRDDEKNELTAGETVIEISETFPPSGLLEPGQAAVKVVRIENTGNLVCAVRCRLVFTDDALELITEPLEIGPDWEYGPDGFYYYMLPLVPGEATKPLISQVVFRQYYEDGTPVTEEDLGKLDAGLMVYSEALEFVSAGTGSPSREEMIETWAGY